MVHFNGNIKAVLNFKNGILTGESIIYYKNGNIKHKINTNNSIVKYYVKYDSYGQLLEKYDSNKYQHSYYSHGMFRNTYTNLESSSLLNIFKRLVL